MALLTNELETVNIENLLSMNLDIPVYQRPYSWKVKSANTLFSDILDAYQNNLPEYRIGSVILHKDNHNYNIVDGQQRITTLSIILYCLGVSIEKTPFLEKSFSNLSTEAVVRNYEVLERRVNELVDKKAFKNYILNNCTMVKIVTDEEQEAFQFFDSQNSRGKELAPHDLLKSYHLREMEFESEEVKIDLIQKWENIPQSSLESLFRDYLYPLTQWYRSRNGLGYSSEKIDQFKGVKVDNIYNFAIYHKASNLYIEQTDKNGMYELVSKEKLNQFQITQPIISGNRFFKYTIHYYDLLENIIGLVEASYDDLKTPNVRAGDIYVKRLYESSLMFFADRFGLEAIDEAVRKTLYRWSYSIRLVMYAVYPQTINNYARGRHSRVNEGRRIFQEISEMNDPKDLSILSLESLRSLDKKIYKNNEKKYKSIYQEMEASYGKG